MTDTITTPNGSTPQPMTEPRTETDDQLMRLHAIDARRQRLIEPQREVIQGIFDDDTSLFTTYTVRLRFTGEILGGVPKRADIIEGWLRTKTGVSDQLELRAMVIRALQDQGAGIDEDATYEEIVTASKDVVGGSMTNGFKRDEFGLYIEGRQVKAMLKEAANVIFGGRRDRWGVTKKGPKSAVAEWVFVAEDRIHLMTPDGDEYANVTEPSDVKLLIGHVTGPQGPRSTLGYHESVLQPAIGFTVFSLEDRVTKDQWKELLMFAQRNGLGAVRSQGHGQFRVIQFDRTEP